MFSRIVIAIAFIAVPAVWSYSAGAPPEVCGDLLPKHHVAPQSSRSPYAVTISSEQVRSGDTITIKIAGKSPKDTIKGFFVEVLDGNNKPIGSFDIDPQHPLIQTRNCFGGLNNGITHKKILSPPNKIEAKWTAPAGYTGPATVVNTVVLNGGVFWVKQNPMAFKIQ